MTEREVCPVCAGTGELPYDEDDGAAICPGCDGDGLIGDARSLPDAGIRTGVQAPEG